MEPRQIEEEVDALEPKVERLKAIYEQYFLGLEKLEPTTLRSEVDRKLAELRKGRIQATRVRYKLQMIIQRYNTYQQYWARVTREMERGTYMRDVLRVAKRIGSKEAMTILGQKRVKMFRDLARVQEERRDRRLGGATGDDGAGNESPGLDAVPAATEAAPTAAASSRGGGLEDPAAWDIFSDDTGEPLPPLQAASPFVMVGGTGSSPPKPLGPAVRLVDDDDAPTLPPPSNGKMAAPAIPRAPRPPAFEASPAKALVSGDPPPPVPALGRPAAPARPPQPRAPAAAPGPPPPPPAGPPRPAAPPGPPPPPPAVAAKSPSPAGPPPRAGAGAGPPPPTREAAGEGRMKEIYTQYVAAKQRGNEPVEGLSYEKLRKSLERQADQLRAAHGQRQIDFEVVTKDGRTLIRPVVR